jgi:N-acyl-D-aspartate/D-glutamate deacylase
LDDPNVRPRLLKDVQDDLDKCDQGAGIFIARYSPKPEWIGKSVQQIAEATGQTSLAVAEEITRGGGAAVVNFSMSEDDVRMAMQRPWVATASDGRSYLPGPDRPHPRSYGTFSRKIGHYSIREGVLPLEQAIRSASGLPAEILGLTDRGTLAAGQAADVVVFDPKAFIDQATFDAPHQYSAGARYVFVNGVAAVAEGVPTGALAGRALRKSQTPKAE